MKQELEEYISGWISKAEHDVIAAETIIRHAPMVLDAACFHCQQAVEKYLKAFLVFKGEDIRKTHDVILLHKKCREADNAFEEIDLKELNSFSVNIRYPDQVLMPDLAEAEEYLLIARHIAEIVRSKITF